MLYYVKYLSCFKQNKSQKRFCALLTAEYRAVNISKPLPLTIVFLYSLFGVVSVVCVYGVFLCALTGSDLAEEEITVLNYFLAAI